MFSVRGGYVLVPLTASFRKSVPHRDDGAIGPTPETAAVSKTAAVLFDRVPDLRNDAPTLLASGRAFTDSDLVYLVNYLNTE